MSNGLVWRGWYRALDARDQRHVKWVGIAMLVSVAVQAANWIWYVEDAAISFSYARYWVEGEGLVPWPGSERVEGYSNPLWVLLLAMWHAVGVSGWVSARVMGAVFGAATVPLVYLIARESRPDKKDDAPLLAVLLLVFNAQFAIWNASGLENSLFVFLLSGAIWRTLIEARDGGYPWASVWFLLLAVTRPEGIAYGAVGGLAAMVWSLAAGRGLTRTLQWLATFFLPFTAYHYIRYQYFAYAFPMTYYAKIGHRDFAPLDWDHRGWVYARDWAGIAGIEGLGRGKGPGVMVAYFAPIFFAAATGLRGRVWRQIWLVATLTWCVSLLLPIPQEIPALLGIDQPFAWLNDNDTWTGGRALVLLSMLIGLSIAPLARRGGRAVTLSWAMAVVTLFFCLKATGDWMKGYRWFNMLAPTLSVVAAVGITEVVDYFARRWGTSAWGRKGWQFALVISALMIAPHVRALVWFGFNRVTSPYGVMKRVAYRNHMQKVAHLDEITFIDVDMGASMWYSEDGIVDMAGLIDIPIAQHRNTRKLHDEYLFEEVLPEFAHIHDAWERKSRIPSRPQFKADYVAIPGYASSWTRTKLHVGSYIRREEFLTPTWNGTPGQRRLLDGGMTLEGLDLTGNPAIEGGHLFLSLGMGWHEKPENWPEYDVLVAFTQAQQVVASVALEPMHGWFDAEDWRGWAEDEVATTRFSAAMPAALVPGTYQVRVVVLDEDGNVRGEWQPPAEEPDDAVLDTGLVEAPVEEPKPATEPEPEPEPVWVFAKGEVTLDQQLTVVDAAQGEKVDAADFAALEEAGRAGDVDAADAPWWRVRWRHTWDESWYDAHEERGYRWRALARVVAAERSVDQKEQARLLREGWELAHRDPEIRERTDVFADVWQARGDAAYQAAHALQEASAGDCQGALSTLQGLSADPHWDWLEDFQARAVSALDGCAADDFDPLPLFDLEEQAWEECFQWERDALFADMRRSWARRYMEEARGQRLSLVDDAVSKRRKTVRDERRKKDRESREKKPRKRG